MSSSFPALPTDRASRGVEHSQGKRTHRPLDRHHERDGELVKRARAGDPNAWGRLYQNHFDRAYRYVLYLVALRNLLDLSTKVAAAELGISTGKLSSPEDFA